MPLSDPLLCAHVNNVAAVFSTVEAHTSGCSVAGCHNQTCEHCRGRHCMKTARVAMINLMLSTMQ
jgi:hypothetical protein